LKSFAFFERLINPQNTAALLTRRNPHRHTTVSRIRASRLPSHPCRLSI